MGSIEEIRAMLSRGELSARELVMDCLERINADTTNSVIELNPEAIEEAAALDSAQERGVLYGIPVLVKDNIDTSGAMATSAGSLALAGNIARKDAPIVRRLREAGAVVLGKTNMSEFANYMVDYRSTAPMPNGYSSRGGQTKSTYPGLDPSGSSTGSAVAVAAGLAPAALGTETSGSIVAPSQRAGVVGLKPTAGRLPGDGIVPISFTLDTPGPIATNVADVAVLFGVMAGQDIVAPKPRGLRVGILKGGKSDPEWLDANEALIRHKGLGLQTKYITDQPGLRCTQLLEEDALSFLFPIMRYEFRHAINLYLQTCGGAIPKTLGEIIDFNNKTPNAMRYGQGNLVAANNIGHAWAEQPEYIVALDMRREAQKAVSRLFDEFSVDAIFLPGGQYGLAAATGLPSITIPTGRDEKGHPIGCCIIAPPWKEAELLAVAAHLEYFANMQ